MSGDAQPPEGGLGGVAGDPAAVVVPFEVVVRRVARERLDPDVVVGEPVDDVLDGDACHPVGRG